MEVTTNLSMEQFRGVMAENRARDPGFGRKWLMEQVTRNKNGGPKMNPLDVERWRVADQKGERVNAEERKRGLCARKHGVADKSFRVGKWGSGSVMGKLRGQVREEGVNRGMAVGQMQVLAGQVEGGGRIAAARARGEKKREEEREGREFEEMFQVEALREATRKGVARPVVKR